jgi:hypothetical protein
LELETGAAALAVVGDLAAACDEVEVLDPQAASRSTTNSPLRVLGRVMAGIRARWESRSQ